MRGLLAFSCRAFPPEHRARHSEEVVDTALLAADGSPWRGAREAFSLVVAGLRQRLRAERDRSVRDGAALLAGLLGLVNLAVALAGITAGFHGATMLFIRVQSYGPPYVVDWWWVAFNLAAIGVVLGLVLGARTLAVGASLVNLALVGYDAIFLANGNPYDGRGHFDVFTYTQTSSFPAGRQWFVAAAVLWRLLRRGCGVSRSRGWLSRSWWYWRSPCSRARRGACSSTCVGRCWRSCCSRSRSELSLRGSRCWASEPRSRPHRA
jgi:hypothetical protein